MSTLHDSIKSLVTGDTTCDTVELWRVGWNIDPDYPFVHDVFFKGGDILCRIIARHLFGHDVQPSCQVCADLLELVNGLGSAFEKKKKKHQAKPRGVTNEVDKVGVTPESGGSVCFVTISPGGSFCLRFIFIRPRELSVTRVLPSTVDE